MDINGKTSKRQRFFAIAIMVYLTAAFAWWAVLLLKQNRRIYELASLDPANSAETLSKLYHRQEMMIFGEGLFFTISLLVAFGLIYRIQSREAHLIRRQRNFLLSVTHELKSPLAAIQMTLDTFRKKPPTEVLIKKLSQNGYDESKRLHNLVNNLLLTTRLQQGYEPFLERLDLTALVQDCVDTISARFPLVVFETAIQSGVVLQADRLGIESILLNLLENAAVYAGKSPISLIITDQKNKTSCIRVADLGPGISESDKKKVFQPFFRVQEESIRNNKGTGLGLFIVRNLTVAHGGKINLKNNTPTGTVFEITFPQQLFEPNAKETA
jgi:signal transduction histidine kinase